MAEPTLKGYGVNALSAAVDAMAEDHPKTAYPGWVPGTTFRYVRHVVNQRALMAYHGGFGDPKDVYVPQVFFEERKEFKPTADPLFTDYNEPPAWGYLRWCAAWTEETLSVYLDCRPIRYDRIVKWDLSRDPNPRKQFRGEKVTKPEIKLAFEWERLCRVLSFLSLPVTKYAVALTAAAVKLLSPDPVEDGAHSPTSAAISGPTEEPPCLTPTYTAPSSSGPNPRPEDKSPAE